MKAKEWEYLITRDEIYFTKDFRFPLKQVMEVASYPGKSNSLAIIVGIILIFVDFAVFGISEVSPVQGLLFVIALLLIVWGIYAGTSVEVGFVIMKDPKRYEKTFVSVLKTHSKEEAEEMLRQLHTELSNNGREKARIVRNA